MRVSTKIVSGVGILLVLTCLALAYQISVVRQLLRVNQDLSAIDFRAASESLRTIQLTEVLDEFSRKYFVARDPVYEKKLDQVTADIRANLSQLRQIASTEKEQAQVDRVESQLADYLRSVDEARSDTGAAPEFVPVEMTNAWDRLRAETQNTYDLAQVSIRNRVARASAAGKMVERFSWIAGAAALLLGIGVALVLLRSIHTPLRRLTQGTHSLTKNQFWHRLPADGSDEFSELARDFNTMTARLGELDQMKKDFVSHVSHDLKAPLASMRQVMHLLLEEIPGELNGQQRKLLDLSYKSAERLSSMVGNLLDVSRMEAGTMEYEMGVHDLIAVVRVVADEFEVQAHDKGIQIHVESDADPMWTVFDKDRLMQVLGNLYDNALKFSPAGGQILTHITRNDVKVKVSVADAGPGVAAAQRDRVFQKFHQIKQGKKLTGQGVGLGLAICKTIVEAHGGGIWVENGAAGGSVFTFTLTAAEAPEAVACEQA